MISLFFSLKIRKLAKFCEFLLIFISVFLQVYNYLNNLTQIIHNMILINPKTINYSEIWSIIFCSFVLSFARTIKSSKANISKAMLISLFFI